jgi:phosphoribosyl 1,2-cyclic phosphodiesterase
MSTTHADHIRIRVLGARGSFPVNGPQFQKYGGRTTALILEAGDTCVIVDAGSGLVFARPYVERFTAIHMVVTHFHMDHVLGFPFFPYHLRPDQTIHFHYDLDYMPEPRSIMTDFVRRPYFPMDHIEIGRKFKFSPFSGSVNIDGLKVEPFALNHPDFAVGYRFTHGGRVFVHASDHEHLPSLDAAILRAVEGADLLTMDGMYDLQDYHPGWGHSTWKDVCRLADKGGVGKLLLWHHHYHYTDDRLDGIVAQAREVFPDTDAAREEAEYLV